MTALLNDPHVLYCVKLKSQVKHGNSADGQMIDATGLLPISNGAVCRLYAANKFAGILKDKGITNVSVIDLANGDITEAVSLAFKYDKLVVAAASYDGGVFPCMLNFLNLLSSKAYQNRTVGIIENGSWAPSAMRTMKPIIESYKNINLIETSVTIKSSLTDKNIEELNALADELIK